MTQAAVVMQPIVRTQRRDSDILSISVWIRQSEARGEASSLLCEDEIRSLEGPSLDLTEEVESQAIGVGEHETAVPPRLVGQRLGGLSSR